MQRWRKVLLISGTFGLLGLTALGQGLPPNFCSLVEGELFEELKPIKIDRSDQYRTDCKFEFVLSGSVDVMISIERFASAKLAARDISASVAVSSFDSSRRGETSYERIDLRDYWDEAFLLGSVKGGYRSLEMRRSSFVVSALSTDTDSIFAVKKRFEMREHLLSDRAP